MSSLPFFSILQPSCRKQLIVDFTSSPFEQFLRIDFPSASAENITARWEIDLSPPNSIVPESRFIFSIVWIISLNTSQIKFVETAIEYSNLLFQIFFFGARLHKALRRRQRRHSNSALHQTSGYEKVHRHFESLPTKVRDAHCRKWLHTYLYNQDYTNYCFVHLYMKQIFYSRFVLIHYSKKLWRNVFFFQPIWKRMQKTSSRSSEIFLLYKLMKPKEYRQHHKYGILLRHYAGHECFLKLSAATPVDSPQFWITYLFVLRCWYVFNFYWKLICTHSCENFLSLYRVEAE